ncbi:MAG TPA: multicopper oxidase family protein [Candidatus Sulfotelmatobacter sp.]
MRFIALIVCLFAGVSPLTAQQQLITDLPEVRGPFSLTAMYDFVSGHNAFAYADKTVPPVIRVLPGGVIKLRYVNNLPGKSDEECATSRCGNMTNLHFHGLHVSPESPEDDVLTMMAMPGGSLNYKVIVPSYSPPGLYWYHTHPHGESARQDLDGMSGAIVVEGIDRYYPELRHMRERVLILRDHDIEHSDATTRQQILRRVEIPSSQCGTATEQNPERVFTTNGEIRPRIPIGPGERQFWRIVNASPDRYADLQLSGEQLEIVALDGMPLSYHSRRRATRKVDHVLVPPAGRVEMIVVGPSTGSRATLSTACVDTGSDGDPNPAMVIADVGPALHDSPMRTLPRTPGRAVHKDLSRREIQKLQISKPDFTVTFTEDKSGFYLNGRKFSMDDQPMLHVRVGSLQHWRIVNPTREIHPFHIHQIHFLAYAEKGVQSDPPDWLDTVNVPYGNGSVDLIMDFTDPLIRGMSVFHCHLLGHEDKGMMAKILFE